MYQNYLKVALRNLLRNKMTSLIKFGGIAVGMACCILIFVYLHDELNYNKFHKNSKHIYRANWVMKGDNESRKFSTTPVPLAPALIADVPHVLSVTRLYNRAGLVENPDARAKRFQERSVHFADQDFFSVFTINFIQSDKHPLAEPGTVVLTDEMAIKYFGTTDVLGKTLKYENNQLLKITGVAGKFPPNSDFQFDFLVSFETLYAVESREIGEYLKTDWTYNPATTYLVTKSPASVEATLRNILTKYGNDRVRQMNSIVLQPLEKVHLYSTDIEGRSETGSIAYIYIFTIVSLLILFIANVNFVNLSNAQAFARLQEVGMRKVLGANRKQLIAQFLGEGLLGSVIAFILAVILAILFLPLLNSVTNRTFSISNMLRPGTILLLFAIFLLNGFLASWYPSVFVTRLQLKNVLVRKTTQMLGGASVRKVLIASQFAIAVMLIVGVLVIQRQLTFLRNKPLGFQKEQVLSVPLFGTGGNSISHGVDGPLRATMNAFEAELLKHSNIHSVSLTSEMPGEGFIRGLVIPEGKNETDNIFLSWVSVDYDFLETLRISLIAGRTFSKQTGTDHLQAFIINESTCRMFNYSPESAIGKNIIRGDQQNGKKGQIIGVIKDFHYNKLDQPLEPLIMDVSAARFTSFAINVQSSNMAATLELIESKWNEFFPQRVFEYSFLEEDIDNLYRSERNLGKMISSFAAVAVFLACLGLFSLVSFMVAQRTREIGIRKVLGASVQSMVALLSKEFMLLILVALVIGGPLAALFMRRWLQDFAYRIHLEWWMFALAAVAILMIALVTVSIQAIRAALINPVKALRNE